MSQIRKILFAVAAFGGAVTAVGAGTFASFTASTTNAGSTFATGTLVLDNDTENATDCYSTGGGSTDSNAGSCAAFNAVALKAPGQSASKDVTIENDGSLAAAAFRVGSPAICDGDEDAAGESFHGTGNLCDEIALTIQSYSDSNRTTPNGCIYGNNVDGTPTTCDATLDYAKDLTAFSTTYTAASPLAITAPSTGLAAGEDRYYRLTFTVNPSAGNEIQGIVASYSFIWSVTQ